MSSDTFLWVDKYAPSDFSEFVGNASAVHDLKLWANQWASGNRPKPVLLVGDSGNGKTSLGHLLGKFMQWQVLETNCSDERTKAGIERVVGAAHGVSSFSGGQRLLLIDEVDGLSSGDRGGAAALAKLMREPQSPMVLTANDLYAKGVRPLSGLAKVVKLKRVNYLSIAKRLQAVCKSEGISAERDVLVELAKASGGDLRAALLDLQNMAEGKASISMTDFDVVGYRDESESIFKVLPSVFHSMSVEHVLRAMNSAESSLDLRTKLSWIDENLPRQYEFPFDLANAFNFVSRADLFLGRVMRRQYYGFWRFANVLMSAGVAVSKVERYRGFKPFQYPSLFVTIARNRAARAVDESIGLKVSDVCHVSVNQAVSYYIPLFKELASNDKQAFVEACAQFDFELKEVAYLYGLKDSSKEVKDVVERAGKLRGKEIGARAIGKFSGVLATMTEAVEVPVVEELKVEKPQQALFETKEVEIKDESKPLIVEEKQKSLFDFK